MGNAAKFRDRGMTYCPDEYLAVADSIDLEKTWDYLQDTFKVSKKWKADFKKQLQTSPRNIPEIEFFVQYMKATELEQAIDKIIQRQHSSILILGYILKQKLQEKKKEAEDRVRYYKTDAWKKDLKRD